MVFPSGSRDRILSAARREFAQYGFAGARVARIARQAAVNKQLIFYYFESKAGLHAAVAEPDAKAAPGDVPPGTTPPEHFRQAISRVFAGLEERPDLVALLTDRQRGPEASAAALRLCQATQSELARSISEGQGLGYYRDDVDPQIVACQALVLCAGFLALEPLLETPTAARREWGGAVADLLLTAAAW
jgi:TetR/AcrR family transcriptional regulator